MCVGGRERWRHSWYMPYQLTNASPSMSGWADRPSPWKAETGFLILVRIFLT